MKFILLLTLPLLVSSTLSECEKQFLKACRKCDLPAKSEDCPLVGYDCETISDNFETSNGKYGRDCQSLTCKDKDATLFVEGVPYKQIACADGIWRYGKHYTLKTTEANCIKRCDNCKTYYPKGAPTGSKDATIVAPVVGTQCASATCPEGFDMIGIKEGKGNNEEVATLPVKCSGGRVWTDSAATPLKFKAVYCRPINKCAVAEFAMEVCPGREACDFTGASLTATETETRCASGYELYISANKSPPGILSSSLTCSGTVWKDGTTTSTTIPTFATCSTGCIIPIFDDNICPSGSTCDDGTYRRFNWPDKKLYCSQETRLVVSTKIDANSGVFLKGGLSCIDKKWVDTETDTTYGSLPYVTCEAESG